MHWLLFKKLLRELWSQKAAILSLVLVCAGGISSYVALMGGYRDLSLAKEDFFSEYHFADWSLTAKTIPSSMVKEVAMREGVRRARGRVVEPIRVKIDGVEHYLPGMVRGFSPSEGYTLNAQKLVRGELPGDSLSKPQALLHISFARARSVELGSFCEVLLRGQKLKVEVCGFFQSPETSIIMPPKGALVTDEGDMVMMIMEDGFLGEKTSRGGSVNQLLLEIEPSIKGSYREKDLLWEIESLLKPYGLLSTVPQSSEPVVQFLDGDIQGLWVSATMMPAICLGVMAMVLHVVLSRYVLQQRVVVGTLRAVGYPKRALIFHYLGFGLVVATLSSIVGVVAGVLFQGALLKLYLQVYQLPIGESGWHFTDWLLGAMIAYLFTIAGSVTAVFRVSKMEPTVAMRPMPMEEAKSFFYESWEIFRRRSFVFKYVFRNLLRNPFRVLVTMVAAFCSCALMVEAFTMSSNIDFLMNQEFVESRKEDLSVALYDPQPVRHLENWSRTQGLDYCEFQLLLPGELYGSMSSKQIMVTGLPRPSRLYTPLDAKDRPIRIHQEGIVLSDKLAEILGVSRGDEVEFEPSWSTQKRQKVEVVEISTSYLGLQAFMSRKALARLVESEDVSNLILVKGSRLTESELRLELEKLPAIESVSWREQSLKKMKEIMEQGLGSSLLILMMFSGTIAFGSLVNTALVNLGEREREIAILRILGYSNLQATLIFCYELLLLNLIGIFLGWFGGIALVYWIFSSYSTEFFRFPFRIDLGAFFVSSLLLLFFVFCAFLVVGYFLRRLNWLESLKVRE